MGILRGERRMRFFDVLDFQYLVLAIFFGIFLVFLIYLGFLSYRFLRKGKEKRSRPKKAMNFPAG